MTKFKKGKKKSWWLVYVLHKNVKVGVRFHVILCSGAASRKCTKKCAASAKLLFFIELVGVAVVRSDLKVRNNIYSDYRSHWTFKANRVVRHYN